MASLEAMAEDEGLPEQYQDKAWRLNNLYQIIDKTGQLVPFRLNWAQQILDAEQHDLNLVLKARQLGCTTYIDLDLLDDCLFTPYLNAGIVAHKQTAVKKIFQDKVRFPYEHLPERLQQLRPATAESANELRFGNHSAIRVDTSLRSGTFQRLHISEYGIVCAKYPEKAREIKTGALNTVAQGQKIWIESTAKGRGGHFYELCKQGLALLELVQSRQRELGPMDWKLFFFPWWQHPEYETEAQYAVLGQGDEDYFEELAERHAISLTPEKKAWYVKKRQDQGDDMKQEYPSTPQEAFEASVEGSYWGKLLGQARQQGRIIRVPADPVLPVHTFWDLGFHDYTTIWFVQFSGQEVHVIDYLEHSGEGLAYYARRLQEKAAGNGYVYGEHWGPHDLEHHELGHGTTRKETAASLGINFRVVPRTPLTEQIEAVRNLLHRCWFDEARCQTGVERLENYRKEWNGKFECWSDHPVHDENSHGAAGFQQLALAVGMGAGRSSSMSEQEVQDLIRRYGRRM